MYALIDLFPSLSEWPFSSIKWFNRQKKDGSHVEVYVYQQQDIFHISFVHLKRQVVHFMEGKP